MLADHVYILSGGHQHSTVDPTLPFQDQPQTFTRVHIGRNTWIGTNTVVMADIGDNCVIGAGSVVTRPVPSNTVAVGNPARVIRSTSSREGTGERAGNGAV
jgi:acetyltransferase-like isoleucine patch superfamily enzyme